jgi:fatty acid desaturase
MNVSRGLFRAWIVISIIWIVGAAVFGYATVVPDAVHGDFQAVRHSFRQAIL